jgi:hypothetical protein
VLLKAHRGARAADVGLAKVARIFHDAVEDVPQGMTWRPLEEIRVERRVIAVSLWTVPSCLRNGGARPENENGSPR